MTTDQFKPLFKRLRRYFVAYGGWSAVFGSPLFLASVGIAAVSYGYWITPKWIDLSYMLIPSLLGFSLGTYAILFSLITNRMRKALKFVKSSSGVSYLEEINATFFHFIFVQIICIGYSFLFGGVDFYSIWTVISREFPVYGVLFGLICVPMSFVGMVLLVYSLSLVLGAALAVYRLALITDPKEE